MWGIVITSIGAFSIVAAIKDWDFFMNHRKAKLFVKLFGRNGARKFYVLLGSFLVIAGALVSLGIIQQ